MDRARIRRAGWPCPCCANGAIFSNLLPPAPSSRTCSSSPTAYGWR
ncbi:hypothetical protein QJS66_12515 [Kocuria rhizophila]|nr:hypothetical protein QJS66_12515 [Kocuria rhizophila]